MSETTGSPESQERAREFYVHKRERKAGYHNELDRTIKDKVLGKNKATERGIAEDEAAAMDGEIERLIDSGEAKSRSEAVNMLNQREDSARSIPVFNPSPQYDGGKSMRYAGNFKVNSNRPTSEEGGEEKDV